jgi:hypothetical protein
VTATSTAFGAARTICGTISRLDFGVLFELPKPALRVVAIRRAACLFVDTRSDEHHVGSGKRLVTTTLDINVWAERRAEADIGRNRFCDLAGAVQEQDFARTAPHHCREGDEHGGGQQR